MKLEDFYNTKYKNISIKTNIAHIVKNPKDRFEMAAMIASKHKGNYLEIGAGSGLVARAVQENYKNITLTELSSSRVKELRTIFKDNLKVTILQHDIEKDYLNYENNYFDVIILSAVIEHLIDPISVLKKLYTKLKTSGILIIDTPNIAKHTRRIKLLFGRFPSTASLDEGLLCYDKKRFTKLYDEGHLHYFTFRSISKILIGFIGFREVRYLGYGSLKTTKTPFFLAKLLPKLFSDVFIVAKK